MRRVRAVSTWRPTCTSTLPAAPGSRRRSRAGRTRVGATDATGLPHPRSFGNHARVIARYVKDRRTISLEEAVRKMTSWPATRMRLVNRGTIEEGNWADVTIFDLAALDDRATYERPMEFPVGIEYVIVNGVVTIDRGRHTGARAGRVLYGPGKVDMP